MNDASFEHFRELLSGFETAMLTTRHGRAELRSRPMRIAESTAQGRLWFITSVDSAKVADLTQFPFVNAALQDGRRFLSISGTVRIVRDAAKRDALWTADQRVWFERGADDPEVVLLEITPMHAEYWDRGGSRGLRFAFAELRAWIAGRPIDEVEGTHGKLEFGD